VTLRRLVLLRHAQAAHPGGMTDHQRPLTERGRLDAAAVGRWLAEHDLVPDLVLASDARRTLQTWQHAQEALGDPVELSPQEALYESSPATVVHLAAAAPAEVRTLLVVGHQPTMSAVADGLVDGGGELLARVNAHLPTSGVVVLELDGEWSDLQAGSCRITELAAPRG